MELSRKISWRAVNNAGWLRSLGRLHIWEGFNTTVPGKGVVPGVDALTVPDLTFR